jgi:hypothetical protein
MSIPPIVSSSTGGEGGGGDRGGGPSQRDPAEEIAGMTVPDLLNVLGLHAPVQAGAIKGRVQRRLDALPRNRTYDRGVLKAIERKLLDYMRDNNLVTILLNEESEDYTAIQDTGGQVSQDPTRFYGNRSYPQTIVAGDVNPIDRRIIKKTLVVDSSYRKQYVAGDGIRACAPLGCVSTPEEAVDCCANITPSNSVPSCYQAPSAVQCNLGSVDPGPSTDFSDWRGDDEQRYIEAYRNQFLNCQPNAGLGVVLPCKMYQEPAANYHFDLQRSTVKVVSMELTSIQLAATAVLTVPTTNPNEYLSGPGEHNLQCVYPSPGQLQTVSQLDPRSTIWIVDETNYAIYPLSIPAGHYPDTFSIAQAITTAWQRLCQLATHPSDPLFGKEGAFRADGVRTAYVYDPANQSAPFAISPAHTNGHVALSVPTEPVEGGLPGELSVWFVPPPQTPDGYLDVQARGTADDDCPAHGCFDTEVCPSNVPSNISAQNAQPTVDPLTGAIEFNLPSTRGVAPVGGQPRIPPVIPGQRPQVYQALPNSLGWVLGFRVAQLSSADFAPAPQPNPSFYPQPNNNGGTSGAPVFPLPGTARSVLIGSAAYQSSPPYLFLRINDHNNNYYAAVEGISGESVMPPDTLAVLELHRMTSLQVAPLSTQGNPPVQQHTDSYYRLSPHVPYKRTYFGAVDIARINAVLLDSNRNVCDLGQNNYSFTLTFETLYNL